MTGGDRKVVEGSDRFRSFVYDCFSALVPISDPAKRGDGSAVAQTFDKPEERYFVLSDNHVVDEHMAFNQVLCS